MAILMAVLGSVVKCATTQDQLEYRWHIWLLVVLVAGGCLYALIRRWRPLRGIDTEREEN